MSGDPRQPDGEQDLLDRLRSDWQAMGSAAPSPLDEDDGSADAATAAATAWMRDAWNRSLRAEAPPMPLSLAVARRRARRAAAWRARRRWLPAVAIGGCLVAAGAWALRQGPSPHETTAKITAPSAEGDLRSPDPRVAPTVQAPAQLATPVPTFEPDGFRTRPDGVEIRQGSVRIILIRGAVPPAPAPTRR